MKKLTRSFFEQNTLDVAKKLLGQTACLWETSRHNYRDPRAIWDLMIQPLMPLRDAHRELKLCLGPAGYSYIYLIYGMYHCFNIVTEKKDFPAAVLIRGLKITDGPHLDGPGKICKYVNMTKKT